MTARHARLDLGDGRRPFAALEEGAAILLDAAPWLGGRATGERIADVDEQGRGPAVRRLVPVEPTKILCVGRNYGAHAAELGNQVPAEPLLFLKPPSALIGPDAVLELPSREVSTRIEHEVELGVVIGQRLRRVSERLAEEGIFGYTVVGDITARDLQQQDKVWTRAKGMDGFCPVGPVVVRGLDVRHLRIRCWVNGELRQDGDSSDMVFSPAAIVAYASRFMTLEPGDLLATGTPSGVGPLADGDRMMLQIEGIGELPIAIRGSG